MDVLRFRPPRQTRLIQTKKERNTNYVTVHTQSRTSRRRHLLRMQSTRHYRDPMRAARRRQRQLRRAVRRVVPALLRISTPPATDDLAAGLKQNSLGPGASSAPGGDGLVMSCTGPSLILMLRLRRPVQFRTGFCVQPIQTQEGKTNETPTSRTGREPDLADPRGLQGLQHS
jgi:hypothetical protein